jgi:zinc protease
MGRTGRGKGSAWSVAVAVAVACGGAQRSRPTPPEPPRTTQVRLASSGFTAGNGLRVVTVTDADATQVHVTMRYGVGAQNDPIGQDGMAHLVEHLMFGQVHEGRSLMALLGEVSTAWNAFTTVDATTYVSAAPADRLADLLEIEGLRLGLRCQTITDAVFARELEVVLNERRESAAADRVRQILTDALMPPEHPYRRSVIGTEASLRSITLKDACAFIDAHYSSANAVLVVSGPITDADVDADLARMLGRVTRRPFSPSTTVPSLRTRPTQFIVDAPVEAMHVVAAWPLPPEPGLRAMALAIGSVIEARINSSVRGPVGSSIWGGQGAELFAVVVQKAARESEDDVLAGIKRAVDSAGVWIDDTEFAHSRGFAAFSTFTMLERAETRDLRLAADMMLPGRTPGQGVASELRATDKLTLEDAERIAHSVFDYRGAAVITLRPKADPEGVATAVTTTIHEGGRRADGDPATAHTPAAFRPAASPLSTARTRTLANGLRVVLMPRSSVPTVELRLVFGAGTADDPPDQHGVAQLAAWYLGFPADARRAVYTAHGSGAVFVDEVTLDATTIKAYGLDMYIDKLIDVVARRVRDGRYDEDEIDDAVAAVRKRARDAARARDKDDDASDERSAEYRAALYGDHPYATAGQLFDDIDDDDVSAFRKRYYTPANATLVIAGGFDADLADAWIDYAFGDWTGAAPDRSTRYAELRAKRISVPDADATQLGVVVAMKASPLPANRAAQLVAAEMVAEVSRDVREQLAATYGVSAGFVEQRQAAFFVLRTLVDRGRATEALALLATRLAELRAGGDAVAGTFVAARRRVLERLAAPDTGATALAALVGDDAEVGRDLKEELGAIEAVRALTIDDLGPILAGIDPADGVILVRGPERELPAAFTALAGK